jgi:deoxycytidylate deaminase
MKIYARFYENLGGRDLSSKQEVFINFVRHLADLSKCKHGQVAAILVSTDFTQVFSVGINGGPVGQKDCVCKRKNAKYGCAHAEQNCLVKNYDRDTQKIMICTTECCPTCATLIVNANINLSEFWYIKPYKDHGGLDILTANHILVSRIDLE